RIHRANVGAAAGTGHPNDGTGAVAAEDGGHADTAAEGRVEREKALQRTAVRREGGDIRPTTGARAGDDVRQAIVINTARGDIDSSREALVVGEEAVQKVSRAIEDGDVRPTAGTGAGNHIGLA